MFLALWLGVVFAFANWQRGRGTDAAVIGMNRWECCVFVSVLTMITAFLALGPQIGAETAMIVFWGFMLYLVEAWGVYFSAFTGHWSGAPGVRWIDRIVLRLFPLRTPDAGAYARGTLGMALRGLFVVPMFTGLAFALDAPQVAFLGLAGALQGPVYAANRFFYRKYGAAFAEIAMGFIIGAAVGIALCQARG